MPDIPDVIQARAFQVMDDEGRVRAELKTTADGEPSFALFDTDGQIRLCAELNEGCPVLTLNDQEGQTLLEASVAENGGTELALRDKDGRTLLQAYVASYGRAGLCLSDQDDRPRIDAFVNESGDPILHLLDQNGQPRFDVSNDESGNTGLSLHDQNGQTQFDVSFDEYGQPLLSLHTESTQIRLGAFRGEQIDLPLWALPGLYITDPDDKLLLAASEGLQVFHSVDNDETQRAASLDRNGLTLFDQNGLYRLIASVNEHESALSLYGEHDPHSPPASSVNYRG